MRDTTGSDSDNNTAGNTNTGGSDAASFDADVAIVGAGPIGLETHWALQRAGASVVHLEAGAIGSTMAWWAPGTRYFSSPERIEICNVPMVTAGQDKATREEYLAYLAQVAGACGLRVRTGRRVVDVRRVSNSIEDGFEVEHAASAHGVGGPEELTGQGVFGAREVVRVRRVVLAVGNMHRPRMLNVEGEQLAHVSHYLRDPLTYRGRRVAIVGGKNSAVEAAIRLYRAGARVTVCYRRATFDADRIKYWLLPEIEWLIKKGRIGFEPETEVARIREDAVELIGVGSRAGERAEVGCEQVVALTGYVQDQWVFDRLGIEREGDERKAVVNPKTMETSAMGVHVAGTAAGGSQNRATVFIETSHVHATRIAAAVMGGGDGPGLGPGSGGGGGRRAEAQSEGDPGGLGPDYGAMAES